MIKVIDSFDTINPPDVKMPEMPAVSKMDKLNADLQEQAQTIILTCKAKLAASGEDIDIAELKEIAKISIDLQKAFFSEKSAAVQINNVQQNISNTQLNYFKGIMRTEI